MSVTAWHLLALWCTNKHKIKTTPVNLYCYYHTCCCYSTTAVFNFFLFHQCYSRWGWAPNGEPLKITESYSKILEALLKLGPTLLCHGLWSGSWGGTHLHHLIIINLFIYLSHFLSCANCYKLATTSNPVYCRQLTHWPIKSEERKEYAFR